MNVVVIGSGLSGLTAAAYLAQAGHQVAVFEQYHRPGGVTAPFEADGYRWDLGQLLIEGLGPDKPLGLILAELGIADQVRVRVEDRGCVFPDFALLKPDTYQGPTWRMEQLKELFPAERAGLDRYWADYVRLTRAMTLARRMERAGGWQARALRLRLLWTLLPLLSRACGSSAPSRRAAAGSTALSRPRSRRPGRSFRTPPSPRHDRPGAVLVTHRLLSAIDLERLHTGRRRHYPHIVTDLLKVRLHGIS